MNKQNKIKVSIIEDSEIHKEWLKAEITADSRFDLVSVDCSGRSGIESVKNFIPSLVLLDFQLEDITGMEVAKRIKIFNENIKIFIITAHTEASIIDRLIRDQNIDSIGIKGSKYFEKNFLMAMCETIHGDNYLDPSLLKNIRNRPNQDGVQELTKREFEVLIQSASGKDDIKIADDLCVEPSHIKNIKSKISKKTSNRNMRSLFTRVIENITRK